MPQKKGKVEEYHLLIRMPQIRVGEFTVSLVFSPFFTGKLKLIVQFEDVQKCFLISFKLTMFSVKPKVMCHFHHR